MSQFTEYDRTSDNGKPPGSSESGPISGTHPGTDREFFIRQAFEKNPEAGYELLFRHYYAVLCSHAVRYVYTKEIAEDLVSEVFYTFWKKESYRVVATSYRAYLFEAVRHRCYNYLKWEFGKESSEELTNQTVVSASPQPDQMMEFDELCMRIEKTIETLPPQCKTVFLMHRFEGKSYPAIARNLQISVKAVEAHISKALAVFRKTLAG